MKRLARSDYSWRTTVYEGRQTILIIDHDDGNVSVTNDAENVIRDIGVEIGPLALGICRVYYRDSTQTWDEIKVKLDGSFAGFRPGPRNGDIGRLWHRAEEVG